MSATLAVSSDCQVLVVEDDPDLGEVLCEYLAGKGLAVQLLDRGDNVLKCVRDLSPDVIVLDLMLPGVDGLSLCRQLRPSYSGGILMLTAQKGDSIEVMGLEAGADDFVTKPVDPRVLLARIRSLTRRVAIASPEVSTSQHVGELTLDQSTRAACVLDTRLKLTGIEFDLLWVLAENKGRPVSRDELYLRLKGVEYDGVDRGMDIHVSRIRKKLREQCPECSVSVQSVRHQGYQLVHA